MAESGVTKDEIKHDAELEAGYIFKEKIMDWYKDKEDAKIYIDQFVETLVKLRRTI